MMVSFESSCRDKWKLQSNPQPRITCRRVSRLGSTFPSFPSSDNGLRFANPCSKLGFRQACPQPRLFD